MHDGPDVAAHHRVKRFGVMRCQGLIVVHVCYGGVGDDGDVMGCLEVPQCRSGKYGFLENHRTLLGDIEVSPRNGY